MAGQGAGELPSYLSKYFLKVQLLLDKEGGGRAAPKLLMPSDPSFSSPLGSGACFLSVHQMKGACVRFLWGSQRGLAPDLRVQPVVSVHQAAIRAWMA